MAETNSREQFQEQLVTLVKCARDWKKSKENAGPGWFFPFHAVVKAHDPVLAGHIQEIENSFDKLSQYVLSKIEDR